MAPRTDGGRTLRGTAAILALGLALCSGGQARADTCRYITANLSVTLLPDTKAPTTIRVSVSGTRQKQNSSPALELRLRFIKCDGSTLTTVTLSVPQDVTHHVYVAYGPITHDYSVACGNYPASVIAEGKNGCSSGDAWQVLDQETIPAPAPLCMKTLEELDCLDCSGAVGEIPSTDLKFYKSLNKLFTIREKDKSGALYGEGVNGEFIAPRAGYLYIQVEGTKPYVDVHGSAAGGQAGWLTPSGRGGTKIDPDRCVQLNAGQRFEFNVVTGKSDAQSTLTLTFDWLWWNTEGQCCFEHDQKEIELEIRPLELIVVPADPLMPQRQGHLRSDGVEEREVRIPKCGPCIVGNICTLFNMSEWFIAWPTATGQIIPEGHAKGWKIVGNKLYSPGPYSVEFEFAN